MKNLSLFIDSGAFSAMSQGEKIDISKYIKFIKRYEKYIDIYANLDVIGDAEKTLQNQKTMEKAGLRPLPCYHFKEDIKYFEYYLSNYDYIALGGMVGIRREILSIWLDNLFGNYICDKEGMPKVKVHGFGMTSLKLMIRYPWYCMTEEDHEVLTKNGWKKRNELKIGEEILCFSKGNSVWEPILDIPTFPVKNVKITHLKNRTFDAKITDNHNWLVTNQNKKENNWKFKETKDLKVGDIIPRIGKYSFPTKSKYVDEQIELLGWFWTDGTIRKKPKCKKDATVIYQSQSANPEKCKMIERAIKKLKEPHYAGKDFWELYGPTRDFLLQMAPEKRLSLSFIFELTEKQLKKFVECSILADGTKTQLIRKEGFTITVTRPIKKENLEILRIACLLLGIPTSISKNKVGGKCLTSSSVDWVRFNQLKKKKINYSGNLWCVQVPSKAFYTKSNNKIYVTGNSVDSTSWVVTSRLGGILVPHYRGGKYIYDVEPLKVVVSSQNSNAIENGEHLDSFPHMQKQIILDYIHNKGFIMGKSRFEKVFQNHKLKPNERWAEKKPKDKDVKRKLEIIEKEGISNWYQLRDEMNVIYFLDLEKELPKWPRPINIHLRRKGFLI